MYTSKNLSKWFVIVLLLVSCVVLAKPASARSTDQTDSVIRYVKAGGNGDCSSWAQACELQTAIYIAVPGDQIWVAAGTYKPTTSSNRSASFQMKSGVAIYGGFPAEGGDDTSRDWQLNKTYLSGDIVVPGNINDNCYHVVTAINVDVTGSLDGFYVVNGNANSETWPDNTGGGIYLSNAAPTLTNVTFSDNTATYYGGGIYIDYNSSATLTNVTFSANTATEGGGMFNYGNATLTNVTFSENTAMNYGGGMYNGGSATLTNVTFSANTAEFGGGMYNGGSATLTNVTFSENTATYLGGGMYNGGSATLTDITFHTNTARDGGGIYNDYYRSATLTNVTFSANTAEFGGGMYTYPNSSATLTNVTFSANTARDGGGMYIYYSRATLTNVTFSDNTATYSGGGMYNNYNSATLTNVTFASNTAEAGGGMYNFDSSPSLTNVTFSANTAEDGGGMYNFDSSPSLTNVTFSANTAKDGGGIYMEYGFNDSTAMLTNVTFSYNIATYSGGGMYIDYNSSIILINVTMVNNSANSGGGIYSINNNIITLTNAILWGNSPDQIFGEAYVVNYSDIQGGYPGEGNINSDPLLGPLEDNGGFTLTHALLQGSPAIDAGDISVCPLTDQRLFFRPVDGNGDGIIGCDMGAYEYGSYLATYTINVSTLGNGSVIKEPEKDFYDYREVVTLTAIADPGWSFGGWGGDASGLENPLTLIMDKNFNIEVTFTQKYTLNISTFGNGSVIKEPEKDFYDYGEVVTLTAIADPGWSFGGWGGDASGLENPLTLIIDKNFNIVVAFTQNEYVLSISINPQGQGTVTVTPIKPFYHYGDVVTLTATPALGWSFANWTGGATGTTNPKTITITGNTSVTANFAYIEYTLTTAVSPSGSGSITVYPLMTTYHYGDQVTLTATPNAGYSFTNWSGGATGTTNPKTITITGNTSVTANFAYIEYTLTVTVDPENSGTVSLDPQQDTYHYGDVVTLTATPELGWSFANWTGDATGTTSPVEVTITKNTNVIAHFTQNNYTLTVTVDPENSGTVSLDPQQASYHYGDVVELTATPALGWSFANWTGDATGTTSPVEVTITKNTNVIAHFTQNEYTLTVTVDPENSGTVSLDPQQATYHYGDVVELTATPALGWSFANWTGDATGTTSPVEVTITKNTNVIAHFTQNEYTLTVTVDPENSGTVSLDPQQATYHYGDVVTLTATPALGWSFANWTGDATGTTSPVEVTITKNTNVIAHFTQNEYTLTVTVDPDDSGTVSLDPQQATYHYGDVVTLTATPALGWSFANWTGDATGTTSPVEVTITKNTNVIAHFTQNEYTLTVTVDPEDSGTVSLDPQQATYHYGDVVELTATPALGWSFANWTGDATGTTSPVEVTITKNTNVIAHFTQNEYTLTVTVDPEDSGTVSLDPQQATYHYGDVVELTATPALGWSFANWTGDATGTTSPVEVTITKNTNVIAHFTQNEYTLTVTVDPENSGTVSLDPQQATYHYGDAVELTATPALGWSFANWSGDASGTTNPLSLPITGDASVTAHFTQNEYTLTVTVDPENSGTVSLNPQQATYHYGDVVELTATPALGWSFANWTGDATGTANPVEVTITKNTNVIAHFTQNEYTLTVTVDPENSGTVSLNPQQATYHYGDVVELTATPALGWSFANWTGDATGTTSPVEVTITKNTNVIAHFTQNEYTLTVTVDPEDSGTVSLDPQQATYHYGDVVELTATPALGWSFANWTGDATGTANPVSVTITKNTSVTAHFTQNEYTLTVTVDPENSGTVSLDPQQATYHYGDVVTLTATPAPGWSFSNWTGDATGTTNPVEVTITKNTSVTAHFTQDEYTLTVIISPENGGSVTIEPAQQTYHYSEQVTLSAMANPYWSFIGWDGDASGTDNPLTITILGNTEIIANFQKFWLYLPLISR